MARVKMAGRLRGVSWNEVRRNFDCSSPRLCEARAIAEVAPRGALTTSSAPLLLYDAKAPKSGMMVKWQAAVKYREQTICTVVMSSPKAFKKHKHKPFYKNRTKVWLTGTLLWREVPEGFDAAPHWAVVSKDGGSEWMVDNMKKRLYPVSFEEWHSIPCDGALA